MPQDPLDKAFLAELEALEKFRISYTGIHPSAPLAREDPDVRRLIEAMAMFTARTRMATQRNVGQSMLRIFRQHFPYLLSPIPAMSMLRAKTSARYVDVTEIPRGTDVYLLEKARERDGAAAGAPDHVYRFQTLAPIRILPIELDGIDIYKTASKGFRILFRFAAGFARNDEIKTISLYVNQLNDLFSSLTVFYQLKQHLKAATVVFDKQVKEDAVGQPVDVHFGAPASAPFELEGLEHPLERARSFMHFPQQELFINIQGIKPPRNWQYFTVCLDVDDTWPTELRLTADAFQLHVVPMANVRKDSADPIECDGTKERYPILHSDRGSHFTPHSILGVYRMTAEGLDPMEAAVVGAARDGYEVLIDGIDEDRRAWLTLNLRDAFDEPARIVVDALWHQPLLRRARTEELRVRLADRFVDGVQWSCFGPMVPHADSDFADDRDGLLQLLSIKNQRFLGKDDLVFLLHALGAHRERHFTKLVSAVSAVAVHSKPFARKSSGFKYVYEITLDDLDGSDLAALDLFARRLLHVLGVWSVEEVVELMVHVPNLNKDLAYV